MSLLRQPAPPSLPAAGANYERAYHDQFNNVLRLYFNQLNNNVAALLGTDGGRYLSIPFGAWSSDSDQVAVSTTAAYAVTFDVADIADSVTLVDNSKLTVRYSGVYNLQFSIQFNNTDSQIHDVDVWAAINGTDVPNSNSRFSVSNSHGGVDGHLIAALNLFLPLYSGDYVELYWHTDNTSVSIEHLPAASSPTRPATPSVIATMSFVSALPDSTT